MSTFRQLTLLALALTSATTFASGTPVVYCKADTENVQLTFNLSRTDEEIGDVLGKDSENDQYSTLGEDPADYPSVYVGKKDEKWLDDQNALAMIHLPASTQGFLSQTSLGAPKQSLDVFMVSSSSKEFELRIVASNKANTAKDDMKGLMTLVAAKPTKDIKQAYNLKSVAVTCQPGWE